MMSNLRLVVLALAMAACGGDPPASVDGPPAVDTPSGTACTKAVFDNCVTNTDCTSNNCHFFMQQNFSVCTQACTPGDNTTCPVDKSGVNGSCNNMGICKPAVANGCTP